MLLRTSFFNPGLAFKEMASVYGIYAWDGGSGSQIRIEKAASVRSAMVSA